MSSETGTIYNALAFRKPKKYASSKSPVKKQQSFTQTLEDT